MQAGQNLDTMPDLFTNTDITQLGLVLIIQPINSRQATLALYRRLGNKDRGTITEYFRGICFQKLTENEFDVTITSKIIADSEDKDIINQVESKITEYLKNLKSSVNKSEQLNLESISKGLPKKFHEYLEKVLTHISQKK